MRFLILVFMISLAFADDAAHRPPAFTTSAKKAVFTDFITSTHQITYNITNKTVIANSTLVFDQIEEGYPVFDLIENPLSLSLNDETITSTVVKTPGNETSVRILDKSLVPGRYTLKSSVAIKTLVTFEGQNVKSAFWYTDLNDRMFLERYLPTNLEFDRMKIRLDLKFVGAGLQQRIYTNGTVAWTSATEATVTYPDFFTASSIFFHTAPVGAFAEKSYNYRSIDGREIPVTIYTSLNGASTLNGVATETNSIIAELESDYRAFPHNSVTVYIGTPGMGLGGMEYCGATITMQNALSHELFHSYMGRGIMPANGSSGWIDEALASWRDDGYPQTRSLMGSSRMSAHGPYTRSTDTAAYSFGAEFMGYLDMKLTAKGGLKPFLRNMLETKIYTPYFVDEFVANMSGFYSEDFTPLFARYTYGSGEDAVKLKRMNSIHRKMSLTDLYNLL